MVESVINIPPHTKFLIFILSLIINILFVVSDCFDGAKLLLLLVMHIVFFIKILLISHCTSSVCRHFPILLHTSACFVAQGYEIGSD